MLLAFAISQFIRTATHSAPEHERCLSLFYRHLCRHAALCAIHSKEPAPQRRHSPEASSENAETLPVLAWVGIGAIVIAYINIGAYWSNIELAAEAAGLDGDWSAQVIAWSVLLSFLGCFGAMVDPENVSTTTARCSSTLCHYGHRGRTPGGRHHRGAVRL